MHSVRCAGLSKIRLFLDVHKQFPASKAGRCKMHGAAKTIRSTGLGINKQQQPCCRTLVTQVSVQCCWAKAHVKIARMTLTIKLDGNWSSFQLANSAPPLSVTDSAIARDHNFDYSQHVHSFLSV